MVALVLAAAIAASPTPTPAPTYLDGIRAAVQSPIADTAPCPDRGVRRLLYGAQIADSLVTANAVHRGSTGVRLFGSTNFIGYLLETAVVDLIIHSAERRASCGIKTATDALLGGAAINNGAQTVFP